MRVRSIVLASALVGAATFTFSPALAQEDTPADPNTGVEQENPQGETPTDEQENQQVEETPAEETPAEEEPPAEEENNGPTFAETDEEDFNEIPVTVDPTSGGAGVRVTITAPCDDEDFGAAFLPADKEGDQESDFVEITDITVSGGTLTARFTIPAGSAPGDAIFFVGCGDDVGAADFRVLGAGGTGAAAPAQPVRGEAAFTG